MEVAEAAWQQHMYRNFGFVLIVFSFGFFYKASISKLVSCGPKHKAKDFVLMQTCSAELDDAWHVVRLRKSAAKCHNTWRQCRKTWRQCRKT